MNVFNFSVRRRDKKSNARIGEIITPHGIIKTPTFVPVGTQAAVKSLTPDELSTLGVQLFFVNTYHTYLRPDLTVIKKFGGLHTFMDWQGPIITDSGGFQVFSLGGKKLINIAISESAVLDRERFAKRRSHREDAKNDIYPDDYKPIGELVAIDEDGVTFTSHWDGTKHRFSPESSMQYQWTLGSDIHIAFDECTPYPATHEYAVKAMNRTHRWAIRSLSEHKRLSLRAKRSRPAHDGIAASGTPRNDNPYQALYGVVQGSVYEDLRKESAQFISHLDTDGIAIGGVSVGESKKEMVDVLDWVSPFLPDAKPRHLLGVGEIDDIFALIEHGIDTFDCVQPTRLARMGKLYSVPNHPKGKREIDITHATYKKDTRPIDEHCACYCCRHFSRAYIHHLFRVRELLGYRLATIHNIHYINTLVLEIRRSIEHGTFLELKKRWLYNR